MTKAIAVMYLRYSSPKEKTRLSPRLTEPQMIFSKESSIVLFKCLNQVEQTQIY